MEVNEKDFKKLNENRNELNEPNRNSKIFSFLAVTFIIIAIYFFGYLYTSKDKTPNAFEYNKNKGGYYDYSVSNAIGNGQKEVISVLVGFMLIFILINIYERKGKFWIYRSIIISVISILLVLIIYINFLRMDVSNPDKYKEPHMVLAVFAFLLNSIYIGLTYHVLKLTYQPNKKWYKSFFYYLTGLNILFFVFCLSSSLANTEEENKMKWRAAGEYSYAFATFENLQIASIITVTLFLGFYKDNQYNSPTDGALLNN